MRIAICEDLKSDSNQLKSYVERYLADYRIEALLSVFESGEAFLQNSPEQYDIVFLDIFMEGRNGIETARRLRSLGCDCMIIFTTTSLDHALESYEIGAAHYLVKPIDYKQVQTALDRCKKLFSQAQRYIEVLSERLTVRVYFNDLIFAEVFGNATLLHTAQGKVKTYLPLDKVGEQLNSVQFLRCHRSYIVNMDYIQSTDASDFILEGGQRVPLPRKDKQLMKQRYADYLFGLVRGQGV